MDKETTGKEAYVSPEMEIILFSSSDIIATSNEFSTLSEEDTGSEYSIDFNSLFG